MTHPFTVPHVPSPLRSSMNGVWHPEEIDTGTNPARATVVADWATTAQPASRLAKPVAESYLVEHLTAAAAAGRRRGLVVALYCSLPAALLLGVVAALITTIR